MATTSKTNEVQNFSGKAEDFTLFQRRLRSYLRLHHPGAFLVFDAACKADLNKTAEKPQYDAKLTESNDTTLYDILTVATASGTAADTVHLAADHESGYVAWGCLRHAYAKPSLSSIIRQQLVIRNLTINLDDPQDYISKLIIHQRKFDNLVKEFQAEETKTNLNVNEINTICNLVYAVTKTGDSRAEHLCSQMEQFASFNDMASHLRAAAERQKLQTTETVPVPIADVNLVKATEAKITCFKCKKKGHRAAKCRSGLPLTACDKCGRHNHFTKDCRSRQPTKTPAFLATTTEDRVVYCFTSQLDANTAGKAFIVDSGAARHMSGFKEDFEDTREIPLILVKGPGGTTYRCTTEGHIRLRLNDREDMLLSCLYVPELEHNLFSVVSAMDKKVASTTFSHQLSAGSLELRNGPNIRLTRTGSLFTIPGDIIRPETTPAMPATLDDTSRALWHQRLTHPADRTVGKLANSKKINKIKTSKSCDPCCRAKSHRHSFTTPRHKKYKKGELMFLDLSGPIDPTGYGGTRFSALLVDQATTKKWLFHMKSKTQSPDALRWFWVNVQRPEGVVIKILRSDRGSEFIAKRFSDLCLELGIRQEFTSPYSPEQAGKVERSWRTIYERARAIMFHSGLNNPKFKHLWPFATSTATIVSNILPSGAIDDAIPDELWSGRPVTYDHLRVFGCKARVHIPDGKRKSLDDKTKECIFIGYCMDSSKRCYKFWDPKTRRVIRSLHAKFFEDQFPAREEHKASPTGGVTVNIPAVPFLIDDSDEQDEEQNNLEDSEDSSDEHDSKSADSNNVNSDEDIATDIDENATDNTQTESANETTATEEDDEHWTPGSEWALDHQNEDSISEESESPPESSLDLLFSTICSNERQNPKCWSLEALLASTSLDSDVPRNYKDAITCPESAQWKRAIADELRSHELNSTWSAPTSVPANRRLIGTKWVFAKKRDENGVVLRYKARLVAKGFTQVPGVDFGETFAPVARFSTYRSAIAIAAAKGWRIDHMDVDTAFLNAPMDEEVYISTPLGAAGSGPRRLQKSLYGTKQAQRNWNSQLNEYLISSGFKPSAADPCLYVRTGKGGKITMVVIYVDDILITGDDNAGIEVFKTQISQRFKMKDLGQLHWFLGIKVSRDEKTGDITMTQQAYIEDILERFKMSNCKPVSTPATIDRLSKKDAPQTEDERKEMKKVPYRSLVGSLLFLTTATRPDIAVAVSEVARYMSDPGPKHWIAAKRILRYLRGTSTLGLRYRKGAKSCLVGYADSDWGQDPDTRRSRTGYLFKLDPSSGAISWRSKMQPTVATSSSEAEYMAACSATREATYLRRLLDQKKETTTIFEDNQGCIALAKNPVHHERTKHIDIKWHFIREKVNDGTVVLKYLPTNAQAADCLTKNLQGEQFRLHRKQLLGM